MLKLQAFRTELVKWPYNSLSLSLFTAIVHALTTICPSLATTREGLGV